MEGVPWETQRSQATVSESERLSQLQKRCRGAALAAPVGASSGNRLHVWLLPGKLPNRCPAKVSVASPATCCGTELCPDSSSFLGAHRASLKFLGT